MVDMSVHQREDEWSGTSHFGFFLKKEKEREKDLIPLVTNIYIYLHMQPFSNDA